MEHISRYGRQMKLNFIKISLYASLLIIFILPFIASSIDRVDAGYYTIKINGIEVGAANTEEEVIVALATARKTLSAQYDHVVYMDPDIEITKQSKNVAERMDKDELSKAIYSCMFDNVLDVDLQMVYTVRIGDYVTTLETKEDVIDLFKLIIRKYDPNNAFVVEMVTVDAATGTYGIDISSKSKNSSAAEIVSDFISGTAVSADGTSVAAGDGLTKIYFEEAIVVTEVSANHATPTTVSKAYEEITKEHEEKTVYTVVAGDCMSGIAESNGLKMDEMLALNPGLSETSIIVPGDSIVVTVPKAQITVTTVYQMTYEEDFEAEPKYEDDDNNYRGTNTVLDEGTVGHRSVVAEVTYHNGNENHRDYLKQEIIKESKPKVIAVGTLTPPTYIRPIRGGSVSSEYGYRWGSMHQGVDWYIPQGNTVMAAAEGTVTRAGWFSGYGYCVDIDHGNGTMTRYAHCSEIFVTVGQHVAQGERISATGNTGNSTGPHLHFEIWIGGSTENPLNYVNKN